MKKKPGPDPGKGQKGNDVTGHSALVPACSCATTARLCNCTCIEMHSATISAGSVLSSGAPTVLSGDAAAGDASAARQKTAAPSSTAPDAQSSRPAAGQKKQPEKAARGLPDSTLYGDLGLVKQKEKKEREIAKAALAQNAAAVAAAASRQAMRREASSAAAAVQQLASPLGPLQGPVPAAALVEGAAAGQIAREASPEAGGGAAAPEASIGTATAGQRAGYPAPRVPLLATAEAAARAAQAQEAAARQSSRLSARSSSRFAEVGQQLRQCTRLPALWVKSWQGTFAPLVAASPIAHCAGRDSTIPLPQPAVSKESSAVLCLPGTAAIDVTLLQAGQQHQPFQVGKALLCSAHTAWLRLTVANSACQLGSSTTKAPPGDELLLLCFGTGMFADPAAAH